MSRSTESLLAHKLEQWFMTTDELPVLDIINVYHDKGKHFVSTELLSVLAKIRERLNSNSIDNHKLIKPLLNILLDKHDNQYDYRSYLGLELFDYLNIDELNDFSTKYLDRKLLLLWSDIMHFELSAIHGDETWLPLMPTHKELVINRCTRLSKILELPLQRLQIKLAHPIGDDVIENFSLLCRNIRNGMSKDERLLLQCSIIPVHTVHDEYMFIRILQSFETIFAWIAFTIQSAIDIYKHNISQVSVLINQCSQYLTEGLPLFAVLSTMRPESFREFRTYTEGASAIQSRSYKQIESLCRKPDENRVNSVAYHSVPEVREKVISDRLTLNEIFHEVDSSNEYPEETVATLSTALESFEAELYKWRKMHHGIAVKMLGPSSTGTGYTQGTSYLREACGIPIFTSNKKTMADI